MGHKQNRIERLEEQIRELQKRDLSLRQARNQATKEKDKVIAATLAFAVAILGKPADRVNVDSMLAAFDALRKETVSEPEQEPIPVVAGAVAEPMVVEEPVSLDASGLSFNASDALVQNVCERLDVPETCPSSDPFRE